jgi:PIN domain nuclease of toxin-antitoxin system
VKVLLDTHTFLWWNMDDLQLSKQARSIIASRNNEIYLSAASVWEIAIKTAKGRLSLPELPGDYVATRLKRYQFQPLAVQISHAAQVYELPPHHSDPFDRLLVAQCQLESMPLLTLDDNIRKYDIETLW